MKKHIYYCPNCDTEKMLEPGRHWCDCFNPPFEMAPHSRAEDKALEHRVASMMGALGGKATAKKYGKQHFSNAGKKGMEKRWGKK